MKLNIFNLKDRQAEWNRVKNELYYVWIGNQTGAILPIWCDNSFQKQFEHIKRNYTLAQCKKALNLA